MTTISTTGSYNPGVSDSLFTAVDRNGDQQLSVGEFTEFLNRLVGGMTGSHATGGLGTAATAVGTSAGTSVPATLQTLPLAQPAATEGAYADIPGFNYAKLCNPAHTSAKYTPAVRAFSQAVASGNFAPGKEGVEGVTAYLASHGFPNVKASGDSIDFGDGHGPIDVVTNYHSGHNMGWWFNNQPGAPAPSQAPAGLTYADVLAKTNTYANSKWGRTLTDADIAAAKHDLGFTEGALIDPAAIATIQRWVDTHTPASTRQA